MSRLEKQLERWPIAVRVVPFILFVTLTSFQGDWGEASRYWVYALKTLLGAVMIALTWRSVREMRWAFSPEAVITGIGIFVIWVGLDGYYPSLDQLMNRAVPFWQKIGLGKLTASVIAPKPLWNPDAFFGLNSPTAWFYLMVRLVGSTLVVPPLEEVFYRSFLYRYIIKADFKPVPFTRFNWTAFLVTGVFFGVSHYEWLAGIVCAFAYQGLVLRKGRLGDAMTAHATTNFLLGLWVITRGAWHFW